MDIPLFRNGIFPGVITSRCLAYPSTILSLAESFISMSSERASHPEYGCSVVKRNGRAVALCRDSFIAALRRIYRVTC